MASLVLGGIGSAFFGAPGGFIGGIVGSAIDAFLFGPEDQIIEGARVPDLKVSFSSYGKPIPILHGADRLGSNVVMSPGLTEIVNKSTQGGKGGPKVTTVAYSYTATWRCLFCEGVAESGNKIWADGKIMLDLSGPGIASENSISYEVGNVGTATGAVIRFYSGAETQGADPAEEAFIGAGETSAYRGLVTMVFQDIPLEDYGNRIPQITAKIAMSSTGIFPEEQITEAVQGFIFAIHSPNQEYVIVASATKATLFSMRARQALWSWSPPSGFGSIANGDITNDWVFINSHNGVSRKGTLWQFHIQSGEEVDSWFEVLIGDGVGSALISYTQKGDGLFANRYIVGLAHFGWLTIFHLGTGTTRYSDNILTWAGGGLNDTNTMWPVIDGTGDVWFCGSPIGGPSTLFRVEPELIAGTEAINIEIVEVLPDPPLALVDWAFYLPETNAIIFAEFGTNDFHEYDLATRTITQSATLAGINQGPISYYLAVHGSVNGRIWMMTGNQAEVDFINFQIKRTITLDSWPTPTVGQNDGFYDRINHAIWCLSSIPDTICFLDRETSDLTTLRAVVAGLSSRVGYTDGTEIDASALAPILLPSHIYSGRSPVGSAIDALGPIFGFRAREEDFQIEFILRGGTAAAAIPEDDLGAASGFEGNTFHVGRDPGDELQLPFKIVLNFSDPATDYQPNSAEFSRASEATVTRKTEVINYPGALNAADARKLVEVLGFSRWSGREKINFTTSLKWGRPSAADVLDLSLTGETLSAEVDAIQIGANSLLSFEARSYDAEAFVQSNIPGGAVDSFIQQEIGGAALTALQVGDIPILQDRDDGHGVYLWAGSIGPQDWPGAGIYRQKSGEGAFNLIEALASNQNAVHGVCETVLADGVTGRWDRDTVVRVKLRNGTLSSASETAVLSDSALNACVIGNEICKFATATLVSAGIYDLSILLRGRKGTEHETALHIDNERFALIDSAIWLRSSLLLADLNSDIAWHGVTIGDLFESGVTRVETYQAIGLKPLAPVHLKGTRGSSPQDWTLTWVRRKRGDWTAFFATVGLDEPAELYDLEIMNGATVERTVEDLTSASFTWTEAMQNTDFGSLQSAVTFRVYQINGEGRRGFVAERSIDSTA